MVGWSFRSRTTSICLFRSDLSAHDVTSQNSVLISVLTSCSASCTLEYCRVVETGSMEPTLDSRSHVSKTNDKEGQEITPKTEDMINDFNRIRVVSRTPLLRHVIPNSRMESPPPPIPPRRFIKETAKLAPPSFLPPGHDEVVVTIATS